MRRRSESLIEGKIQHKGRFAFLLSEVPGIEDVHLSGPTLRLAMDGDRVAARLRQDSRGRRSGEIVRVLQRARKTVVGVLRKAGPSWTAVPEADEGGGVRVFGFGPGVKPSEGEIVVVEITQWPTMREGAGGIARESLGRPEQPGVRVLAVVRARGLSESFSPELLAEAARFGADPGEQDLKGRRLLFDLPLFTIDGADAKDFDDAVSLEPLTGGRVRLGVHIADVSHYVEAGTELDLEARRRATSVYLPDRVIPMLPPNLSDHLCSLRPGVPRLSLSCWLEIDHHAKVLSAKLEESAIRSWKRFTYEEVEDLLEGVAVEGIDPGVRESVLRMGILAKKMTALRLGRGALDLSVPEFKIVVDARGAPVSVGKRPRLASHRLIEEFMVAANEAVARELYARGMPFVWRIHEKPDPQKLEDLGVELRGMGLKSTVGFAKDPARALQDILRRADAHPLGETVHVLVVRSLKQAVYAARAEGHFGLASRAYCHFTSPIRRYPDLLVHRAVRGLLRGGKRALAAEELEALSAHCSERERLAADAERKSVDLMRALLLKKAVGKLVEGVVTHVAHFGCFIALSDSGASGLARGAKAELGARVLARVLAVDEKKGELELEIAGPVRKK